jgi:hypothetical protein
MRARHDRPRKRTQKPKERLRQTSNFWTRIVPAVRKKVGSRTFERSLKWVRFIDAGDTYVRFVTLAPIDQSSREIIDQEFTKRHPQRCLILLCLSGPDYEWVARQLSREANKTGIDDNQGVRDYLDRFEKLSTWEAIFGMNSPSMISPQARVGEEIVVAP